MTKILLPVIEFIEFVIRNEYGIIKVCKFFKFLIFYGSFPLSIRLASPSGLISVAYSCCFCLNRLPIEVLKKKRKKEDTDIRLGHT